MLFPTSLRQLSFRRAVDRALKVVGRTDLLSHGWRWGSLAITYTKFLIAQFPAKVSARNPFGKILQVHLDRFVRRLSYLSLGENWLPERFRTPLTVAM